MLRASLVVIARSPSIVTSIISKIVTSFYYLLLREEEEERERTISQYHSHIIISKRIFIFILKSRNLEKLEKLSIFLSLNHFLTVKFMWLFP